MNVARYPSYCFKRDRRARINKYRSLKLISPVATSDPRRWQPPDWHCSMYLRACVDARARYTWAIDEFRLWMQFLRPGANLRLTGISGSPVIGYVEFSDWLSETELRVAEYAFKCCTPEVMDGFVLRHECQPHELYLFICTCVFSAIESG